ncbi:uncharacterized protein F5891DRAFT_1192680 [Suillus fuscotomentosus]|uniref:C2H2-type domain-containing protein n=1 Tax=Suillus fuscotomentosus TaxID=1912939 RepID=A0AAD4DZ46_9AGAM|nr:uncharacterized protein F5891DRAFT_1192680 [Suillus fuscotomentosus]KAG1896783.1 hypothetical protein F5891DRAFT_1192680 [Suillus fuscotomentosus]
MPPRRAHHLLQLPCPAPGCARWFRNQSGLTQHRRSLHPNIPAPGPPQPSRSPSHPRDFSPPPPEFSPPPRDFSQPPQPSPPMPSEPTHEDSDNADAEFTDSSERCYRTYHSMLNGRPCTADGEFLPHGAPPTPMPQKAPDDWSPYHNRIEFEAAEFAFKKCHMSAKNLDFLCDLMAATLMKHRDVPPFADHKDLHNVIDATQLGDVPWQSFSVQYTGERPEVVPPWMDDEFDVWYRDPRAMAHNILANPTFKDEIDYTPFHEYDASDKTRRWKDFMSGDWAWKQSDIISKDPETHGSALVPIILGSDKTTVSVGTGNNEYYPLYASIGNVRNSVRRAHRDALVIIGFLAIPKTDKKHSKDDVFRIFRRQLFHSSLSAILSSLKSAMTEYEVVRCGDGHFRRIIYSLGPYIADYEEQLVLSCIVKHWCPKCIAVRTNLDNGGMDRCREHTEFLIGELHGDVLWDEFGIIGDLVLIKGAFKDHLVDWVAKYLKAVHGTRRAEEIMSDIDRRVAAAPSFSGLRRFPQGRDFKQWTGDDSKALMKVFLPAIEGHVPGDMVRAFRALLEFCYLARRDVVTEDTLNQMQDALHRFHRYRQIFDLVVPTFSLPRQHSMIHYTDMIRLFGAPNGLCSSITESKHIKAAKEPWRWSSRHNALGQMLVTNQRLDKLAASRVDFDARGMLTGTILSSALAALTPDEDEQAVPPIAPQPDAHAIEPQPDIDIDDGEVVDGPTVLGYVVLAKTPQRKRARTVAALAHEVAVPDLRRLIRHFLFTQLNQDDPRDPADVPTGSLPRHEGKLQVFNSAAATFFAPSDLSGTGGMRREHIRACPLWRNEYPRNDCVFIDTDSDAQGMRGLEVARIVCFFSFKHNWEVYPCALIHWFEKIDDCADEDTGMWMVRPSFHEGGSRNLAVIHIETVFRAAHLIPMYGSEYIPHDLKFYHSIDCFRSFYVNKFADHHAFEIAS